MGRMSPTSSAKRGMGVFQPTNQRSFDAAYVSRLEEENRASVSRLSDYVRRRQSDEWMDEATLTGYRDAVKRYRSSSSALSNLRRHLGETDDNFYERDSYISSISDDIDSASKSFGQYKNAEEYGKALSAYKTQERQAGWKKAYAGKTYKELSDLVASEEYQRKRKSGAVSDEEDTWLRETFMKYDRSVVDTMTEDELRAARDATEGKRNKLNAELQDLEYQKRAMARSVYTPTGYSQEDFDRKIAEKKQEIANTQAGTVLYYDENDAGMTYDSLLRVKKAEGTLVDIKSDATANNVYSALTDGKKDDELLRWLDETAKAVASGADYNTATLAAPTSDEDRQKLSYLSQKFGLDFSKPAYALLPDIQNAIGQVQSKYAADRDTFASLGYDWDEIAYYDKWKQDKAAYAETMARDTQFGIDYPIASTIFNILAAPMQIGEYVENTKYALRSSDGSAYGLSNIYDDGTTNFIKASSSGTAQMINDDVKNWTSSDVLAWLASGAYSGVTSSLQSRAISIACTALFGSTVGEALALGIMGTQAAASAFQDAVMNGSNNGEALMTSFAAGVNEALFEKVSLEKIQSIENLVNSKSWNASTVRDLLKSVLKNSGIVAVQGLTEGSEELCTDIANALADDVFNGDHTAYKTDIIKYMNAGYSREDAEKMANQNWIMGVLESFYGGFIGGTVSGSAQIAANAIITAPQAAEGSIDRYRGIRERGASVIENGNVQKLVADAQGLGNSRAEIALKKLAGKVAGVPADTEALTGRAKRKAEVRIGQLYRGMLEVQDQAVRDRVTGSVADNIREALTADGVENVDAVTDVLVKKAQGKQIGQKQAALIEGVDADSIIRNAEKAATENVSADTAAAYAKMMDTAETASVAREAREVGAKTVADLSGRVSDTGKTVIANTGEEVTIDRKNAFKIGKDGETYLNTDKGDVKIGDVAFANTNEALLYEAVADMSPAIASTIVSNYDGSIPVRTYVNGMRQGVEVYGRYNFRQVGIDISDKSFFAELHPADQKLALALGRQFAAAKTTEEQKAVPAIKAKNSENGKVSFVQGVSAETDMQKNGVELAKVLAKATGINIEFFDSTLDTKHKNDNGWYDPKTDTIHVDINAGDTRNGTIAYTLGHELTHFIKKWSPAKFKTFGDFLLEQYGEHGVDTQTMLEAQMQKLGTRDTTLAYEELVADACQTMLLDSNAVEKLAQLRQRDKTLFEKIREFIIGLIDKIRGLYKDIEPDSAEAKAARSMTDVLEQLSALFEDAAVDAAKAHQGAVEAVGAAIDVESGSVSPAFSLRTWKGSDYVQDRENAAKEIAEALGVSVSKAKAYIDDINSVGYMISSDLSRLDYEETGLSPFVGNREYGGSFDYTTLCTKRRLLTGTFSAIQRALPNTALTAQEVLDIRKMMDDAGLEVNCGKCYVEGSRANMGKFTKRFIELYREYNPGKWYPNMAEMNTPDGIEWVRVTHPEVYEQYEHFWNYHGALKPGDPNLFASQHKPKLYQMRSAYSGEVLRYFKGDAKVEEKNRNGGIRMQSFSDFEIVHLIDAMQTIMDMSRVGLNGQAYTKMPDFAWALGNTGLKINLSIDAWSVGEDGKLVFNNKEGMPFDTAMKLRDAYSANVGTICCVYDDAQLLAALADDRIDFVIPFHRSQWKKSQYKAMGLPSTTKDYTYQQNEKWIDPSQHTHEFRGRQVKEPCTNYMPNEYWDFSKSGKENAEAYLAMCARDGKRPKFYKLLDRNADGSYSLKADGSTDGYWKLLIDFKMYDNDGVGSPQMPVRPDFNMTECTRMLNEYKGGHEHFPVAQGIVDAFVERYKEGHGFEDGVKKSSRTQVQTEVMQRYPVEADQIRYSKRTKEAPKKTQEVYKLMRLKDGEIYPLFIDSTEPLDIGVWYDADSPDLRFLQKMPSGIFLVDANDGSYITFDDYLADSGEKKTKYPSKKAIEQAASDGKRWVYIEDVRKGQKRFGGENRKYWNLGINGSGAVSTFSMRPGYHAGSLPSMRQIGKGVNRDLRDDSFVWTVGEVPADINYQAEADSNPDKDIPTHIPVDGYYLKATNADKAKSQADVIGWYVAGSYKIDRIISDSEARSIIDQWNAEHPEAQAQYDYERESGMDFDADSMRLVPKESNKPDTTEPTSKGTDIRYSFRNTKSGMANDSLKPYSKELTDIITGNGDFIVDSFDALVDVVNLAFDEPTKKATAYFGNLDVSILEKIKNSIPDLPSEYRQEGKLFKKGMDHSVAATLDSIRHLTDEKRLSKSDVIDYLDRLADTIADFDTVNFSYYTESRGNKLPGLRFKKTFSDGTFVSFEIPSKKKTSLSMQTMFMEHADYKKRKSAEPPLMQNAPAHTPEVRGGQTSENSVAHGSQDVKTSTRNKSNRELLSEALLTTADPTTPQGEYEAKLLVDYKAKAAELDALQAHLAEVKREIYDRTFGNLPHDAARLSVLRDDKIKTENRIGIYDKKLLRLEATKPLMELLEREKAKVKRQTAGLLQDAFREKTTKIANRAMRKRITSVVHDLDRLLNRGTKERNVKIGMRETVGATLSLANVIFNDEITNEDIIKAGAETATEKEQKLLRRYADLMQKRDTSEYSVAADCISELRKLDKRLADLFARERARLNQTKVSEAVDQLAREYGKLKTAEQGHINFAYDSEVAERISALSRDLAGTVANDMSAEQLKEVYDIFKIVKHMVSESDKLFRMGKAQSLSETTETVQSEILSHMKENRKDPGAAAESIAEAARDFVWNELKPVYAFERLGSKAYMDLFWDAIEAEGVWAKDVQEAKEYLDEQVEKTGYRKWDMQKAHTFTLQSGKQFTLTLQDIMSVYAYSKRDQAYEHMTTGGFQFADRSEYKEGGKRKVHLTGELYTVTLDDIRQIIGELTEEQTAYVDAVQSYLSVLGKKGNEVSRQLYGIDIFNEAAYFPLMSSRDYRSSVETTLNATQTQVSLKNTGMTKQTVPHAKNPIILQGFDSVVSRHIDQMAKYHAYVLPIENLRRVFDSVSPAIDQGEEYTSTKNIIKKVFGRSAMAYFDQYITDLNGGTLVKGYNAPLMGLFSKFKGTAVGASLSVIIQQPFAITRAMDMISPRYFLPGDVQKPDTGSRYEEIKRYAPVAIVKEMGGFDMGNSRTAVDYLTTRTDKGLRRAVDTVNEAAGWGAGKADELGWGIIWDAVKREVAAVQKLKPGTDEFFKACGKRFTEVIVYTQVYDSVNSRSGMMRSKNDLMKFATSFMGEPTTVINMAYNAMLKVQRATGKEAKLVAKRALGRTMGVLVVSQLLTAIAKSVVYAGRDDDDDEAYLERFAGSLGSSLDWRSGDLNPLTMIPFIRDIISIWEGYSVDRPDMTLIANLVSSVKRSIDGDFTVDDALSLIGDAGNIFGLPVRNLIRDAKGIINFFGDIFDGIYPTDIVGAFARGFNGKEQPNTEALYGAIDRGDEGRLDVIREKYKTDASYASAVKRSLRENDPRVRQALKARVNGDTATYTKIRQQIIDEGKFDKQAVNDALKAEYDYYVGKISEAGQLLRSGDKAASDDIIRELKKKYKGTFSQDDIMVAVKRKAGLQK